MTDQPAAITVYVDTGQLRVRVDRPGERAVSAPVTDAADLIRDLARHANLEVTIRQRGEGA